jgi:putative FmdB family regulatory protein
MAIYVYKCKKCGKTFESFQRADENKNVRCVYCDSEAQRIFSPVGIILKGSGFYSTDYRSSRRGSGNAGTLNNNREDGKKSETHSSDKKVTNAVKEKKDKKD